MQLVIDSPDGDLTFSSIVADDVCSKLSLFIMFMSLFPRGDSLPLAMKMISVITLHNEGKTSNITVQTDTNTHLLMAVLGSAVSLIRQRSESKLLRLQQDL